MKGRLIIVLLVVMVGAVWLLREAVDWSIFFGSPFDEERIKTAQRLQPLCEIADTNTREAMSLPTPFVILWNLPRYDRKWRRDQPADQRQDDIRGWKVRRQIHKAVHKVTDREADPDSWSETRAVVCVSGGEERFFNGQACAASKGMVPVMGHWPSLVSWEVKIRTVPDGQLLAAVTLWPKKPECVDPDEQYLPEQELKALLEGAIGDARMTPQDR